MKILILLTLLLILKTCIGFKILAIFPHNGRSHHLFWSSLVEELAARNHDVTVINYFPVKKMSNLRQISLLKEDNFDAIDIDEQTKPSYCPNILKDVCNTYDTAQYFQYSGNTNCERLITNKEVQELIRTREQFDLVISENFVTDCGLALAYNLQAPAVIGMTAHVLLPWTYSRLGASNNPSFVPNIFMYSEFDLWTRIRSLFINSFLGLYNAFITQKIDNDIVKRVYPETPDLETLARNMSFILVNQYFPLTGSRIYGANVIEVGGLHIKKAGEPLDPELQQFLDSAKSGVVFISFGTVAKNFPSNVLKEIFKTIQSSSLKFVWKTEVKDFKAPNALIRPWFAQSTILCHNNVKAFVTHSGMFSTSEAMHCGVPIIGVPLFGDQFANAASAVEVGLGVKIDIETLDEKVVTEALHTVTQSTYQKRAKELSEMWKDRPLTPTDTAVFWINYAAKHKGKVNMKPRTVDLPMYQYLMLDVILVIGLFILIVFTVLFKALKFLINSCRRKDLKEERKSKKDKKKN